MPNMLETFQRCFEGALAVAGERQKSQGSALELKEAFVESFLPSPSHFLVPLGRQCSPGMRRMLPRATCLHGRGRGGGNGAERKTESRTGSAG